MIDPIFAQWLQSDSLWQFAGDDTTAARWEKSAKLVERPTTIAEQADAIIEGQRRLTFFGVPIAVDQHLLRGSWVSSLGRVVNLDADRLGYRGGVDVFVIGVQDELAKGTAQVTVLRRMG